MHAIMTRTLINLHATRDREAEDGPRIRNSSFHKFSNLKKFFFYYKEFFDTRTFINHDN